MLGDEDVDLGDLGTSELHELLRLDTRQVREGGREVGRGKMGETYCYSGHQLHTVIVNTSHVARASTLAGGGTVGRLGFHAPGCPHTAGGGSAKG